MTATLLQTQAPLRPQQRRALAVAILLFPGTAFAHSFGVSYSLPIPLALYGWAAAVTLLLSFVIAAWFMRGDQHQPLPERVWPAENRLTRTGLRLLGVAALAMLLLSIIAGFFGHTNSNVNINMTAFWIIFVLGFTYLCALVGGLYSRINPWRVLAELQRCMARLPTGGWLVYPHVRLGYWPAVVLYLGFIWVELFANTRPPSLAQWLLGYTLLCLAGSALVGARAWFRYCELFSVLLRLIALAAPLRLEHQNGARVWVLRLPFVQLTRESAEHGSLVIFILCMLATTAYDGLHETVPWLRFFWSTLIPAIDPDAGPRALFKYRDWFVRWQWFGLILCCLLYCLAYGLAVYLGRLITHSKVSLAALLRSFGFSLLPIALAYHVAHYYTLLQTMGPRFLALLSDPLGLRWNLFGTADWFQYAIVPQAKVTWHVQVAVIVIGHVAGVLVAHHAALGQFANRRQAALSQLPMLLLMIGYTVAGLWILALPIQTARLL